MGNRIRPYFLATIIKTGDDPNSDNEGSIDKFYIVDGLELPSVVEVQPDGRRVAAFWTYGEAESWLNENL